MIRSSTRNWELATRGQGEEVITQNLPLTQNVLRTAMLTKLKTIPVPNYQLATTTIFEV